MWGASDTFTVNGGAVRIRSNTAELGAVVRTLLADRIEDDDPDGPFAYSIRLEPPQRGTQPLHVLYEDCRVVVRSRDPLRVLRTLRTHVQGRDDIGIKGRMQLSGCAVVGERGVALLPVDLEPDLSRNERRLNAAGLQNVDMPFLAFDQLTAELIVPEPIELDESLLDGLDLYRGTEPGPAAPGRYRVNGWMLEGLRGADDRRRPALELVLNQETLTRERCRRLVAKIQDSSTLVARWYPWPEDLVPAVVRLAEGRR